jgi:hypothetical protein
MKSFTNEATLEDIKVFIDRNPISKLNHFGSHKSFDNLISELTNSFPDAKEALSKVSTLINSILTVRSLNIQNSYEKIKSLLDQSSNISLRINLESI